MGGAHAKLRGSSGEGGLAYAKLGGSSGGGGEAYAVTRGGRGEKDGAHAKLRGSIFFLQHLKSTKEWFDYSTFRREYF